MQPSRDTIVSRTKLELIAGEHLAATYTDRKGTVIHREFAGEASLNGIPVDLDKWPIADSHWVHQPTEASPVFVTDGKIQRTYDFDRWIVKDGPANP